MESTNQINEGLRPFKGARVRSTSYPAFTLDVCVDFTRRVDKEFTDTLFTPASTISTTLKMSGGSFLTLLSSSREYGLLEMRLKEGYKPTPHFRKIKRPIPGENPNDLFIECIQQPKLYQKLFEHFANKELPSSTGLANILDRTYNVKGEGSIKAARVFLKNLATLDLIGPDNTLLLTGGITPTEEVPNEDTDIEIEEIPSISPLVNAGLPPSMQVDMSHYIASTAPKSEHTAETIEIPVFLSGGREARLTLPKLFTEIDLQRVIKVINAYLPDKTE